MKQSLLKSLLVIITVALMMSCDAWQDDIRLKNENLKRNLYELVQAEADLSVFAEILEKTGYDRFLQEEQAATVFAPKNDLLQQIKDLPREELSEWVKNYIAYLSYFTKSSGGFDAGYIRMINEKYIPVNAAGISGTAIAKANLAASNGVLHIIGGLIADRKNILEYIKEQTGFAQIDYINAQDKQMMDTERSVQKGVDLNGQPIYDTVWVTRNEFLERYPLGDETQAFTVLLVSDNALDLLKAKYAKYMKQADADKQAEDIISQLAADFILKPVDIEAAGRFASMEDVLVDVDPAFITETYQASNGKVYKVSAADIKIYENKIKTRIIEAEDYVDRWDAQDAWEVRYRAWASGGRDVILKGTTRNSVTYEALNEETGEMETKTNTYTYRITYRTNDPVSSKVSHPYLKYQPTMYSTDYNIYWVTYDDVESHYSNFGDTIQQPMVLEQKLLISFPGFPELKRESDAKISNNFNSYSLMASSSTAGVLEEKQLVRYKAASATDYLYLLGQLYTEEDNFGKNERLKCPAYGKATFFVSNTVREQNVNAGLIFLDYIRLVPLVDPND